MAKIDLHLIWYCFVFCSIKKGIDTAFPKHNQYTKKHDNVEISNDGPDTASQDLNERIDASIDTAYPKNNQDASKHDNVEILNDGPDTASQDLNERIDAGIDTAFPKHNQYTKKHDNVEILNVGPDTASQDLHERTDAIFQKLIQDPRNRVMFNDTAIQVFRERINAEHLIMIVGVNLVVNVMVVGLLINRRRIHTSRVSGLMMLLALIHIYHLPEDVQSQNVRSKHQVSYDTGKSILATGSKISCYRMSRIPRGYCVMINNETIEGQTARAGTQHDKGLIMLVALIHIYHLPANTSGENVVSRKSSSGYQFKKTYDNTLSESFVLSFGVKMKSVGALVCKKELGTVFRVGSHYVMTACHVVQQITGKNDVSALKKSNVFVNFNESLVEQGGLIYRLTDYVLWDSELDFAVLEISNPNDLLPPGLALCFDESKYIQLEEVSFIGYGHPNKSGKYLDPRCNIMPLYSDKISRARKWLDVNSSKFRSILKQTAKHPSIVGLVDTAYQGLDHPDKLIFDCYMQQGGSGSPALTNGDADSIQVVGILTHELPEFYHHLDKTDQKMIYDEYRFEMGSKMSSILKCIHKKDPNLASSLCT